jgi:ATP citrate (pro-S)-lyase
MGYKDLLEYQVKSLYYNFIDDKNIYKILRYRKGDNFSELKKNNDWLNNVELVCKLDQKVKRRGKNGLVLLNKNIDEVEKFIKTTCEKDIIINDNKIDITNFIIEPFKKVKFEYYLTLRNSKKGVELIFNNSGGVEIGDIEETSLKMELNIDFNEEDFKIKLKNYNNDLFSNNFDNLNSFVKNIYEFYKYYHLVFLEINPLIITDDNIFIPVDFAAKLDDTSLYLFNNEELKLLNDNVKSVNNLTEEEIKIEELDSTTGGSLKFSLLNKNGKIWVMPAGGGASVVYVDTLYEQGFMQELANYGEYSGNPSEYHLYEYTKNIFSLMTKNTEEKKYLLIGGAIANFTDVEKTFNGIIRAIKDYSNKLKNVKIFVRRGGPNYKKGLENISNICNELQIENEVYGPEKDLTHIVNILPEELKMERKLSGFTLKEHGLNFKIENNFFKKILSSKSNILIVGPHKSIIQRMLDFDYASGKQEPSIKCIINLMSTKDSFMNVFWNKTNILLPIYNNYEKAVKTHNFDIAINLSSFRSAYNTTIDLIEIDKIKTIFIFAEGIPERFSRHMRDLCKKRKKCLIGPSSIGGIRGGELRIANTGGNIDNIYYTRLNKTTGNVGFVTRSGGLLNELANIISKNSKGVKEGISIGGDRYSGTSFIDHLLRFENDKEIEYMILLGEVGGVEELIVSKYVKEGIIKKPIIGLCTGVAAKALEKDIQFGHAGAYATNFYESAEYKNNYMESCGIIVPKGFHNICNELKKLSNIEEIEKSDVNKFPKEYKDIQSNMRKPAQIFSSISNEKGEELKYNNVPISEITKKSSVGNAIGHLWFKKDLPEKVSIYIDLIIQVVSDHGPAVSGAMNTIISARAGKDLISSVVSGLLTIGPRFGGAIHKSAIDFYYGFKNGLSATDFIKKIKSENRYIQGIGHRVKSKDNPDKRVEILQEYVRNNFKNQKYLNYALSIEKETLKKKNNLILNVDGTIGATLLDIFENSNFTQEEIEEILSGDILNGFFLLSRTIGFIGHYNDQNRLKQGLFRFDTNDIAYLK